MKAFKLESEYTGAAFKPYLYAGYGMNTSIGSMKTRCPQAIPAGTALLRNYKLVFRGAADVALSPGRQVWLALWWITAECEKSLDTLEGFRASDPDGGLYGKRFMTLNDSRHYMTSTETQRALIGRQAMIYVMNTRDYLSPPTPGYEATLRAGYADFGMPADQIDRAIDEANQAAARWAKPLPRRSGQVEIRHRLAMPTRQASVFDDEDDADEAAWKAYAAQLRGRS